MHAFKGTASWEVNTPKNRTKIWDDGNLVARQDKEGEQARFFLSFVYGRQGYVVELNPDIEKGLLSGRWQLAASNDSKAYHGKEIAGACRARFYTCLNGEVVLLGTWNEDGVIYEWLVKLHD